MMSLDMEQSADAILQAAAQVSSQDELSDVDVDGDGSSSLSEIEDKDADQDEDAEGSDELSNPSDDENDSEAETERLEESPNKFRPHKDVVLNSHNGSQIYERSPSKLHHQTTADDPEDEEDEDPLSDDDLSSNISPEDSPKSSVHEDVDHEVVTATTSLGDSSADNKTMLSAVETDSRKRKRSIMAGGRVEEDLEEPPQKRTGSVLTLGDDYAIEDDTPPEEEGGISNPHSGDISGDEGAEAHEEDAQEDAEEMILAEDHPAEPVEIPSSPKRRGRKKKKVVENGVSAHVGPDPIVDGAIINGHDEAGNGEEEVAENEGDDEAEAALRNEEELEKKRVALEQLSGIEKQFATFRDRLYDERLDQLNREEAMLRQSRPTHPEYLAMVQCIDERRNERIRVADKKREYEFGTVKTYAVARRSQILAQYQQGAREVRERNLEQLGKQWYEIQHDRRNYTGSVPEYTLKFPTRKSQQIQNQVAYTSEVSILSGIAKYVGFPAAPTLAPASSVEMEEDFEKMGRTKQVHQAPPVALPLQELAALRTAGSTSRFKPAEEQFIEQTPWANPQHPSHAHLLQRQTSAQHTPRTSSPFSQVQVPPRRHSHQASGPVSGTFFSGASALMHGNSIQPGGRISPHNPFTNSHSHTIAPSPLGSRQTSLSPQNVRPPPALEEQKDIPHPPGIPAKTMQTSPQGPHREFQHEARREQAAVMGLF